MVLDVRCPHCQAQGRLALPRPSVLLIGPCPVCHELVLIFAGETFPIDTRTFESGGVSDKKAYLENILGDFIRQSVQQIFASPGNTKSSSPPHSDPFSDPRRASRVDRPKQGRITDSEFERFVSEDLQALDNPRYFEDIFG